MASGLGFAPGSKQDALYGNREHICSELCGDSLMPESICIEDFCGRVAGTSLQVSFSADYFPADSLTYFTGDWGADVPPMPCTAEPTHAQVYAWARKHGGSW